MCILWQDLYREHANSLTEDLMKFLRFAALFAFAVIPILLTKKEKEQPAQVVETDQIYQLDLTV
jgi:hypothetical protein